MATRKRSKNPVSTDAVLDSSEEFEQLLRTAPGGSRFMLRLYITGNTVRSGQAVTNIRTLCEEYLPGRYDLEVIDIYQQPSQAAEQQIIAAPTLVRELPIPVKRLIGDLSNRDKVLVGLELADEANFSRSQRRTNWLQL
jgi:circadian clock protein KaiB